jgi:hypothetical protein
MQLWRTTEAAAGRQTKSNSKGSSRIRDLANFLGLAGFDGVESGLLAGLGWVWAAGKAINSHARLAWLVARRSERDRAASSI